jgi:signal transduction histidine kinase
MIDTGEPIVIHDVGSNEMWVDKKSRTGRRAYLGAPIRIASKTEGFINVNSAKSDRFSEQDARRLRAFADHAAIALQNARLFEEKSRLAEDLERRVQARTQELAARTAWSEAILESTSDGIVVTDSHGEIIQSNPVASNWLDHALSPTDAARLRHIIRSVAGQAIDRPHQLVELTGLDLQLRAAPVFDEKDETALATVVAVHDVTHLRALDRMKTQFISDVSHELRTPIASIRLYAALIQSSDGERQEAYFTAMNREIGRISQLVKEILQIARIEAGRLELDLQMTDLNVVVSAAVASHKAMAVEKGLELSYVVPEDPVTIRVDVHWFNRVVSELIENAVNYTSNGEIEISVSVDILDGRAWAVCAVQDTGMGIPDNEQAHIFERFFRGEGPRTQQISGTGLGLAIVQSILDLHGGRIGVESEPDKGSRFTVWIPLVSDEVVQASASRTKRDHP